MNAPPRVAVVIPCFDEAPTIEAIVRAVLDAPPPGKEIIVVDDGSTDGSREVLKSRVEPLVARVLYHDRNRGKGAALRTGFAAATAEIVVIQDADLEYDPKDHERLLRPILEGRADVVFGSRFVGSASHRVLYFWHYAANRILTFLSNLLTNLNLTDIETCYKAFRRELIDRMALAEDGFGFEPEFTAKAARLGCRIYEVGISYSGRTYRDGKKIGWRDGVRTLWCIVKYNLKPLPRRPGQTPPGCVP